MRRAWTMLAAAAGAGLIVVAVATAATFQDPAGDQLDAASFPGPDITTVDVTNTPDGTLTFRMTIANYPALVPETAVGFVLDLDKDLDTGSDGFEAQLAYFVETGGTSFAFYTWDGLDLIEADTTRLTAAYAEGVLTVTVPRSELENTTGFAFGALALRVQQQPPELAVDVAPDGEELWTYDLVGLAPPKPPTLTIGEINGVPVLPVPGKRFVATALVTRSDTRQLVDRAAVSCAVRVGTKPLKATGRHRSFNAQCAMTVPKNAKGKTLRGTMTVKAAGATTTKAFRFRVR